MFFRELETDRLFLRNISPDDRDFIFTVFSNDDVNKYLYDAEPLTDISGADDIIDSYQEPEPRNQHRWAIIRKTDNVKMGTCGFHCWDKNNAKAEIGYDLLREYWGNGYMQEAIGEIIKFAECVMLIKQIDANVFIGNIKSIKLLAKHGFTVTGSRNYIFRGKEYPHKIYSLYIKFGEKKKNVRK
jgi:ribosomal-protein-alanine N-acetyltransferase